MPRSLSGVIPDEYISANPLLHSSGAIVRCGLFIANRLNLAFPSLPLDVVDCVFGERLEPRDHSLLGLVVALLCRLDTDRNVSMTLRHLRDEISVAW